MLIFKEIQLLPEIFLGISIIYLLIHGTFMSVSPKYLLIQNSVLFLSVLIVSMFCFLLVNNAVESNDFWLFLISNSFFLESGSKLNFFVIYAFFKSFIIKLFAKTVQELLANLTLINLEWEVKDTPEPEPFNVNICFYLNTVNYKKNMALPKYLKVQVGGDWGSTLAKSVMVEMDPHSIPKGYEDPEELKTALEECALVTFSNTKRCPAKQWHKTGGRVSWTVDSMEVFMDNDLPNQIPIETIIDDTHYGPSTRG
mgnify:CR=1 FL=1